MSFDKSSFNSEKILLLVSKAQAGDSDAMSDVITNVSPFVTILVKHFLSTSPSVSIESEDLFQEGMLAVLSAVKTFDESKSASFKTYLADCVYNRLISAARKHSKNSVFSSKTVSLESTTENVDSSTSVEDIAIAKERFSIMLDYINSKLSKKELEVLNLFLSGLSYEEIAQKTGTSVKSVDNSLQRVRHKIRNSNL